jgi:hypothetical protein
LTVYFNAVCDYTRRNLLNGSGAITSPYYPAPVSLLTSINKCIWLISAPPNSHVVMIITNIQYDSHGGILIRDGRTMYSPLLATLLQTRDSFRTPLTFRSTSRYMLVWDLTSTKGFHALYRTENSSLSKYMNSMASSTRIGDWVGRQCHAHMSIIL